MTTLTINHNAIAESYKFAQQEIDEKLAESQQITVTGPDDKAGMKLAREYRLGWMRTRNLLEKKRKELKADALEYGRQVDAAAKSLLEQFADEETRLKELEDTAKREEERLAKIAEEERQAKMNDRCKRLEAIQSAIPMAELEAMDDARFEEVYAEKLAIVEARRREEEAAAEQRRLEAERLEAERKAQAEKQAELDRQQAEIRAAEERIRADEAEARRQKIAARREKLEQFGHVAQSVHDDFLDAMNADEFAVFVQTVDAEHKKWIRDVEETNKRIREEAEQRAREEAEQRRLAEEAEAARIAALAPDREKAEQFLTAIDDVAIPEISDEYRARFIRAKDSFLHELEGIVKDMA